MLDTNARKYFNPLFETIAKYFVNKKISANQITLLSFGLGIICAVFVYFKIYFLAFIFLWLSGLFDAVDGEVARMTNTKSKFGAQIDIVSDRIVELAFIWALALSNENITVSLLFLVSMILISMTLFLTTGMIAENKTKKSFYYQSGLMERTEGFIMFSLIIIFNKHMKLIIIIYSILILITIIQRMLESIKINKE